MDTKFVTGLSDQHSSTKKGKRPIISAAVLQEDNLTNSSLEWYRLTEGSRNVLNAIITFTSREQLLEETKTNPDQKKIAEFEKRYEEAYDLLNKSDNFKSLEGMQQILDTYAGVLQTLRQSA
jgi:hypothetical protein